MRQFFDSSEASVTVASWISLNYKIRIAEYMLEELELIMLHVMNGKVLYIFRVIGCKSL